MYGRIYGPYGVKGHSKVIAVLYGEDGLETSRRTIGYLTYLKEYDEGLHRYVPLPKKEAKPKAPVVSKYLKEFKTVSCTFCSRDYETKHIQSKFCSKVCSERHRRRMVKRRSKFNYKDQVVIPIAGLTKEDPNYFVIIDLKRDKRDWRFIEARYARRIVTEDNNRVPIYHLEYDYEQSVRIKTVVGYKKHFMITETGVFVSRRTKKVCSTLVSKGGYCHHCTRIGGRNGKLVNFRYHRLVADAFVPNLDNKPFVNHIDAVKTNNHYTNLEWVTNQENTDHAVSIGRMSRHGLDNETVNKIRALNGVSLRSIVAREFGTEWDIVDRIWRKDGLVPTERKKLIPTNNSNRGWRNTSSKIRDRDLFMKILSDKGKIGNRAAAKKYGLGRGVIRRAWKYSLEDFQ